MRKHGHHLMEANTEKHIPKRNCIITCHMDLMERGISSVMVVVVVLKLDCLSILKVTLKILGKIPR